MALDQPFSCEHSSFFISLEGGEAVGKSTQIKHLKQALETEGFKVVLTREPGGSPGAEALRHVLLSGKVKALGALAEAVLFTAARVDHIKETILPALKNGAIVLCDRYCDSTLVYQGVNNALDETTLLTLQEIGTAGLMPDLTLVLDAPVETMLERHYKRIKERKSDRFEQESLQFHMQIAERFRQLAAENTSRCALIDASESEEKVCNTIKAIVFERMKAKGLMDGNP